MDPSRSHILIHVINNCEGQYNTNIYLLLNIYLFFNGKNRYEKYKGLQGIDIILPVWLSWIRHQTLR